MVWHLHIALEGSTEPRSVEHDLTVSVSPLPLPPTNKQSFSELDQAVSVFVLLFFNSSHQNQVLFATQCCVFRTKMAVKITELPRVGLPRMFRLSYAE